VSALGWTSGLALDSYGSSPAQNGKKSQGNLDGSGSSGLGLGITRNQGKGRAVGRAGPRGHFQASRNLGTDKQLRRTSRRGSAFLAQLVAAGDAVTHSRVPKRSACCDSETTLEALRNATLRSVSGVCTRPTPSRMSRVGVSWREGTND
jgi:hypothetical protein